MNKYTYTVRGSKTTHCIADAPRSVQAVWNEASLLGINIIRVRQEKERYETTKGKTFFGWHQGVVSIYQQLSNPIQALWFRKKVKLGGENKGMQVLEIADNTDVENTLKAISDFQYHITSGFFARLFMSIRRLFA
jgi:hypothetical protein